MCYELSNDFFEKILREFENNTSIRVNKVEISPACAVGDNFISDVKRVIIQGSSDNKVFSKNFIVKLVIQNEEYNKNYGLEVPFLNEIVAYKNVIPELQKYSKKPLAFPICIYADDGIIILEDCSTQGYKTVDIKKGFTTTQIQNILQELANFHAASLVLKIQKGDAAIDEIGEKIVEVIFDEDGKNSGLLDGQIMNIGLAIKAFQELPQNDYNKSIITNLKTLELLHKSAQLGVISKKCKFKVVNHGDAWGNNILVNPNDEIKLIDLQIMRYTSVAADLSYFLYVNLSPKERKEKGDQFLRFYLNKLNGFIKEQGFNLEDELTIEWLNNEMKEFAIFGCISGLWFLPVFFFSKDELSVDNFDKDLVNDVDYQWSLCKEDIKIRMKEIVMDFFDNNDIEYYRKYLQK